MSSVVMEQMKRDPTGSAHYTLGYVHGVLLNIQREYRVPRDVRRMVEDAIAKIAEHDKLMQERSEARR